MVGKVQREFSPAGRKSKVSTPVVIRYPAAVITPAQIKAARALLRWDQTRLALEAGLSPFMIKNIERGGQNPSASQIAAIEQAFIRAGVVLLEENNWRGLGRGVRFVEGE